MKQETIAVIGGGSAGLTAARTAHEMGARVLFFMGDNADRASLCINAGCMPSKAMFEPIDTMHHARRHGWLDVDPRRPDDFLAEIVRWKDREIARFRAYRQAEIRSLADDRFEIIRANAWFINPHELESVGKHYRFDAAIIASGSLVRRPKMEGLDPTWDGVWTNEEILSNIRIPESLAVIGAGAVGLEFSLRYARLGSDVTLISHSRVLPRYPAKFGERLALIYEREGVRVLASRKIARIARDCAGFYEVGTEGADGYEPIMSEKVLFATGRRPAVDHLRLDAAGISLSEKRSAGDWRGHARTRPGPHLCCRRRSRKTDGGPSRAHRSGHRR